jgi:hypothetical protein
MASAATPVRGGGARSGIKRRLSERFYWQTYVTALQLLFANFLLEPLHEQH